MEKTRRETLAPFSLLAEPKRLLTLGLIPASGVVRAVVSESKAYLEVRTADPHAELLIISTAQRAAAGLRVG